MEPVPDSGESGYASIEDVEDVEGGKDVEDAANLIVATVGARLWIVLLRFTRRCRRWQRCRRCRRCHALDSGIFPAVSRRSHSRGLWQTRFYRGAINDYHCGEAGSWGNLTHAIRSSL